LAPDDPSPNPLPAAAELAPPAPVLSDEPPHAQASIESANTAHEPK
jgi:hypothetical protein